MPIRDKVTNLLAPVKQRLSRLHSPEGKKSTLNGPSETGELDDTQDVPQSPKTHQGQPQPVAVSPPSQPIALDDSVAEQPEGLSPHDPEEKASVLSNLSYFSQAALGVAKEFSEPFPPLKYSVTGLLVVIKGFEKVDGVQDDFAYAAQKLTIMKTTYTNNRSELDASERMKPCLETVTRTVQMVEKTIKAKADRGILKRIWEYPNDIKAISNALRMLGDVADYFVMNVTVSTHSMVQDQILDKLTFVENAHFLSVKSGRQCTEGTRTELLTDLLTWGTAVSDVPKVCLVTGPAGSGKSTIAHTVCSFLQGLNLLGGSFFCSRDDNDKRRSTQSIFSTLARSLATHDRDYASALVQVVRSNAGAGSFVAKEQLTNLIIGPIRGSRSTQQVTSAPVRVCVIDALDECADDDKTVYDLICTLLVECDQLPLKFLITSRPESRINRAFDQAEPNRCVCHRVEDIPENIARSDVLTYLRSELDECARACQVPTGWPPVAQVEKLAEQAGTLFIYASTACKYIWNLDDDVAQRLEELTTLDAHQLRGIDPMYEFVLHQVRQSKSDATWEITRRCLQAIVRLRRQLSLRDMAALMDIDCQRLRMALAGLQSIISIPSSDHPDVISIFHASFPDYLVDEQRSQGKAWSLESTVVHTDMLHRCLSVMTAELRFNISNSHSSYSSNAEQPSQHSVSGALHYSCLHWIDHLEGCGDPNDTTMADLSELICERFLYWLEALSATSSVQVAPFIMTRVLAWMNTHPGVVENANRSVANVNRPPGSDRPAFDLPRFAVDARAFINAFAVPIGSSCPHIYLSALAATSKRSEVWSGLSKTFNNMPATITLQPHGISLLFILRGHKSAVTSVAFSPDGTRIVSASDDQTILLWNTVTGAAIGEPLRGHESSVTSMAFSPDGARIVSCSNDQTIRLWDAGTGLAVGDPIRGHEHHVRSVKFSPNGTRIASGSLDRTIRLWDATTGAAIGEPMRGHEGSVECVAFSPDGTRIASGSSDWTSRLWDVATGAAIGEPLRGHENSVRSVAFSPDGTRIVSGAEDQSIRLWDVATMAVIAEPLHGHEDWVRSVAFSSDGTRIVSGSDDHTVRLWNATTGAAIGEPLRGHDSSVQSVAFSPDDGIRIISGSEDQTIRVWDAATSATAEEPLHGHESSVEAVAFSPDGTRVASGSFDWTICRWDAVTGAAIGKPLHGHENWVRSVKFSPDGTRIVSGCDDRTIRLWDATMGVAIGEPWRGHEHWVTSVAFSLDGTFVVSGSQDQTIRLWDAATGAAVGEPLRGHEGPVLSVAFSQDGTRIVSGSEDQTVRLWNVATKAVVGEPLRGHKDFVWSVAFSPNGTRIVSGSEDKTIRLWDVPAGVATGEPLLGHEDLVRSVMFSPDGTRIISGSDDQTIRIWDAETGAAIAELLRGHEGAIGALALSPDGMQIVSASLDGHLHCVNVSLYLPLHSSSNQDPKTSADSVPHAEEAKSMETNHLHIHPDFGTMGNQVAFSRDDAHSTCIDSLLLPGCDPRDILSLDRDGWLKGPNGELFLWILPEYRRGLWWPRTTAIMGAHPVMLDLSHFAHGTDWAKCFSPGAEKTNQADAGALNQ